MKYLIRNINEFDNEKLEKLILNDEQSKKVKSRSTLISYYLLDLLLRSKNMELKDIKYKDNKPYIDGCYISVSHKDNYVACAIAENEIGIDIEKIKDFEKSILVYFFNNEERKYILSSNNVNEQFFILYTIKESISKISGLGIKSFLDFSVVKNGQIKYKNYKIITKKIDNDYILSICQQSE